MSNAEDDASDRFKMNRLGATLMMLSKGAVFFQAGEEMLRSKPIGDGKFDENSYKSSDEINNIRWDLIKDGSMEKEMLEFYKGLIKMRKSYSIFTDNSTVISGEALDETDGRAYVTINDATGGKALVVINPTPLDMTYDLDCEWNMICNGVKAGAEVIETISDKVNVPAYSAVVLVN